MLLCFASCKEKEDIPQGNQSVQESSTNDKEPSTKAEISNELTEEETVKKYFEAFAALDYDTLFDFCVNPNSLNI